jgi:surface protein
MFELFNGSTIFNGNVSDWDVSKVIYMQSLFRLTTFNGDISSWDVSSVNNMQIMFHNTTIFSQNISNWRPPSGCNFSGMFSGATGMDKYTYINGYGTNPT